MGKYHTHKLYAIIVKFLNICKQVAGNFVNESGNVPGKGVVPGFSDLEIMALNMTSETVGIDSKPLLFAKLQEYWEGYGMDRSPFIAQIAEQYSAENSYLCDGTNRPQTMRRKRSARKDDGFCSHRFRNGQRPADKRLLGGGGRRARRGGAGYLLQPDPPAPELLQPLHHGDPRPDIRGYARGARFPGGVA